MKEFNPTDHQITEWTREAGLNIFTNFDREMFRRFAKIVIEDQLVDIEAPPASKAKAKTKKYS